MIKTRGSGILLHPTSLPGPFGIGDLGESAYQFIDFLVSTGQKYWQVMPLGPTGYGDSPYACLSAFAGNPLLISLEKLVEEGYLPLDSLAEYPKYSEEKIEYCEVSKTKVEYLKTSFVHFMQNASMTDKKRFSNFCDNRYTRTWLDNFALFMALKENFENKAWDEWPQEYALRTPNAMLESKNELAESILFNKYLQYQFYKQWSLILDYAHLNGIEVIGDIPIFVARDSADVWAYPGLFYLDASGKPTVVSGVPPDYFSETGQLWGNPIYRWDKMKKDNYLWWTERFKVALNTVDIIRLDHFRGFEAYWEVAAGEETAINGKWVKGPFKDFFSTVESSIGNLPFIAEDLGVITPEVEDLRDAFNFPGMKVLQFAFDTDTKDPFLPHNHINNCVVYTGTHDNQTTVSWFESRTPELQEFALNYMNSNGQEIHWDMIKMAMASVANTVIIPMQDLFGLTDEEGRMNTPGKESGNWQWRYVGSDVHEGVPERLQMLTELYDRL